MPALPFLAPALALSTVLILLLPYEAEAFVLTDDVLGLDQRHFLVFDNFADAETHTNTTEHPMFPGHTGPAVAIWKASVEWGSELHGDGSGDPTQAFDLGSGGANFDAWFRGPATSVGNTNSNTHSAILGSSGGIAAYTETPSSDGWRIRYYDDFTWSDAVGAPPPGTLDLQALATHEYGHALGLGHSSIPGATMGPAIGGDGTNIRSIEADDKAAIQAKYGVKAASKPHVTSAALVGGTLYVSGSGFSPTGNELWFNSDKIIGLVSVAGGRLIVLGAPPGLLPGDVLVKKNAAGYAALSNAQPFDPSLGCGFQAYGVELEGANAGALSGNASPSVGGSLQLSIAGLGASPIGLLVLASAPATLSLFGGILLVDLTQPYFVQAFGLSGGAAGLAVSIPPGPGLVGQSLYLQAGAPDASQAFGTVLTNGLAATFCP